MFPHKGVHNETWRSPDGRYANQIDHVLVNLTFSNCVLDIRTFRGADCGSHHFLVASKLKVLLKKIKNRTASQSGLYNIQKLSNPKVYKILHVNILSNIYLNKIILTQ